MARLCAIVLVALAISPLTAPFCTFDVSDLAGIGGEGISAKLEKEPFAPIAPWIASPPRPPRPAELTRPSLDGCAITLRPGLHIVLRL
jgi:hypothetical protein